MKNIIILVLTVAGGAYANRSAAFVHPGWVFARKHDLVSSNGDFKAQTLALDVGGSMVPHPEKVARGGEDAFFVLENDFGVFDGVGAWAAKGHDPGVFARGFAQAVAANITAQRLEADLTPKRAHDEGIRVKRRSFEGVNLQQALEYGTTRAPGIGTCTACVVTFDPVYGMLNGANLGDSGALLIRKDARGTPFVALRSVAQRHSFNQPYQLGTGSRDRAADAQPFLFYVREGDVVVLATDGLLDNMYEADIVQCVSEAWMDVRPNSSAFPAETPLLAAKLASVLAYRAFNLSQNEERVTPWEEEAVAAGIIAGRGDNIDPQGMGRQPIWSWDPLQLGSELKRSLRSGLRSIRAGVSKETDESFQRWDSPGVPKEDEKSAFRGGKADDITVVVATVRRAEIEVVEGPKRGQEREFPATDVGAAP